MKKNKEKIKFGVAIGVFAVIIAACLISIFTQLYTENKEKEDFRQLEGVVTEETTATVENEVVPDEAKPDAVNCNAQKKFTSTYYQPHSVMDLLSMNPDCFGWISIAGTSINYPVMHTPSDPQKYLNRSFYGNYSQSGTPFLDGRCTSDSTNLIIYGHHMNNGTMFADLCNYTSKAYRDEHPAIVLETKEGASSYSVFSVMKVKSDDDWYKFTTVSSEKSYSVRINCAKEKSLYDTGINPVYGQQILTLSTCCGYNRDDRILVLAVKN